MLQAPEPLVARALAGLADADLAAAVRALRDMAPGQERIRLAVSLLSALLRADVVEADATRTGRLQHIDELVAIVDQDPPAGPQWLRLRASGRALRLMHAAAGALVDVSAALRELDELQNKVDDFPPVHALLDAARTTVIIQRGVMMGDETMFLDLPARAAELARRLPPEARELVEPAQAAVAGMTAAITGDQAGVRQAVEALRLAGATMPAGADLRAIIDDAVTLAAAAQGATAETSDLEAMVQRPDASADDRAMAHLALAAARGTDETTDIAVIEDAIEHARGAAALLPPSDARHVLAIATVAMMLYRRSEVSATVDGLDEAARLLDEAHTRVGPGHLMWTFVNELRGHIQARLAQHAPSRQTRLDAQRGYAWRVLLRPDPSQSAQAAHAAAENAIDLALQCLGDSSPADAVRALDTGRGLMLFAATESRRIADRLRQAGHADLADRWTAANAAEADEELRREVLTVLSSQPQSAARLLDPPTPREIQSALSTLDADALVYLVPASPPRPGAAVIVPVDAAPRYLPLPDLTLDDSHVQRYLAALDRHTRGLVADRSVSPARDLPGAGNAVATSLGELCHWAWLAAIGPVLQRFHTGRSASRERPPRLILVPMGDLARIPWHAARDDEGRYAVQLAALSQIPSARMLCDVANRPSVPVTPVGLVVGDPHTDAPPLLAARREAYAVRQAYYRGARYIGRRPDGSASPSGPGTPAQVRRWLADTDPAAGTVLHLACHGVYQADADSARSYLLLAGDDTDGGRSGELSADELVSLSARAEHRGLAVVVLAACNTGRSIHGYDEAYSLGTAFLVSGARSVLSTQWNIPDHETSALMFMFHHLLRHDRRPVWAALREAQLWMLNPNRQVPPDMPAEIGPPPTAADPVAWAGFVHWGQ